MKPLPDISALVTPRAIVLDGKKHRVKGINAIVARLAQTMTLENRVDALVKIVSLVVPTLSIEDIEQLELVQLDAILDVASAAAREVQDADPNATRPATETQASPA